MAGADETARFARALQAAGLVLDARDQRAALRVYAGLARACQLLTADALAQEKAASDEPR